MDENGKEAGGRKESATWINDGLASKHPGVSVIDAVHPPRISTLGMGRGGGAPGDKQQAVNSAGTEVATSTAGAHAASAG